MNSKDTFYDRIALAINRIHGPYGSNRDIKRAMVRERLIAFEDLEEFISKEMLFCCSEQLNILHNILEKISKLKEDLDSCPYI